MSHHHLYLHLHQQRRLLPPQPVSENSLPPSSSSPSPSPSPSSLSRRARTLVDFSRSSGNHHRPPPPSAATTTGHRSSFGSEPLSHRHHCRHHKRSASAVVPSCLNFRCSSSRWGCKLEPRCSEVSPMASRGDRSSSSSELRKRQLNGQKKKEELEREVSMLQLLLSQEEKVREILERVQSRKNGSTNAIPKFLPPKIKELLAELAMVEDEIARLEGQISRLQANLKNEEEATKEAKSRQTKIPEFPSNPHPASGYLSYTPSPSPLNRVVPERMAFETKALHFISKAIKGDYNIKDFTLIEKTGNSRQFSDQKENHFLEDAKFHDRLLRKSRMLKPALPLQDLRHPTPKPRERRQETPLKSPPMFMPSPMKVEDNKQKWEPNKLSENIMKCLNFVFIRLLRMSRVMELEKSGPVSRSLNSTLNSRSFRVETGLSSRQQDPYGVFDMEDSIPRDIGPYKNLVRFTASSMDPKCISSSSSIPLLKKLRDLMSHLKTVDLRFLTNQQKLAFWINMYNACIMHGSLQYGVPSTPEKLLTLMNKATLDIGGNTINAQAIEHFILRKPATSKIMEVHRKVEKDAKEDLVREVYGLENTDPNVTFALCRGTRSSPAVRIYTADGLAAELEKSKLEYLQASVVVTATKRIAFPELLLRNMHDFATIPDALVEWVCHQLPTSGTLRKSIVDCFRSHNGGGGQALITVQKIPYDYEFQYLLAM
ncbi:uncharacterized protein LOC115670840 isoform X1 [Syzygium oleosum]|uniref:uncharacterized protein LOC115670840 isoform X1 n=1 Tax=Syzygium oleosum TaxID=219896 RepID=UPI0011D260F0|nr:uncharacterized protein LOC115670840 isoform X1 [Syzygium oleosum]